MLYITSKQMRYNPLFMRNSFVSSGKWGLPLIKKQELNLEDIKLLACTDTKLNEREENKNFGIHFFC